MSDRNQQLRRLRAGNFIANNGRVMRDINLLRHKHIDLRSVRRVEQDLCEQEFLDCINFLSQEGYIALRRMPTGVSLPVLPTIALVPEIVQGCTSVRRK